MKKIFTTNLLLLLLVNILIKPFWIFGIDRTVQNIVGAGEYGIFYTLFNFSLLLNILLDFGMTNFNNREISRHPQLLGKYLSNIVGIKILLAVVYAFFTIVLAVVLGYDRYEINLLLFLVLNQFLSSLILYLRSNISGLQLFKLDSVLSVLDKSIMIVICGILLWSNFLPVKFTINHFVYAQTASYIIATLVVFAVVLRKTGAITFRFYFPFTLSMLRKSFPYAVLVLLMTVYGRVDSVMIERILPNGNESAGIYAQAFRLLDAVNMFPFLFASLLLPIFSRMIKNRSNISSFVGFSTILLMVPVISFTVPTFVFRGHIMDLLYHEHAVHSSEVLGVLLGSFIFISVGYIYGTLLTAQGDIKNLNRVSAIAVVVSISVQFLLVSKFQVIGAAFGNLITNGLAAILSFWLAFRRYRFKVDFVYMLRFLLFFILAVIFSLILFYVNKESTTVYIIALIGVSLLSLILKLINLKELVSFFTKESALE
ncbi:MAG: oligosaccharide flippase family protein [Bacteroidales bacterium]